jgi:hypothetical protein
MQSPDDACLSRTWNATVTTPGPSFFASQRTSGGGFVGGGQLGCDYQFGGLVVGVEGMWTDRPSIK